MSNGRPVGELLWLGGTGAGRVAVPAVAANIGDSTSFDTDTGSYAGTGGGVAAGVKGGAFAAHPAKHLNPLQVAFARQHQPRGLWARLKEACIPPRPVVAAAAAPDGEASMYVPPSAADVARHWAATAWTGLKSARRWAFDAPAKSLSGHGVLYSLVSRQLPVDLPAYEAYGQELLDREAEGRAAPRRSVFLLPMLHPHCGAALGWAGAMLCFDLVYTAFWVPVNTAFCLAQYGDLDASCTQVGLTLAAGYRSRVVTDGRDTAALYVRTWTFWVDLLAIAPFIYLTFYTHSVGSELQPSWLADNVSITSVYMVLLCYVVLTNVVMLNGVLVFGAVVALIGNTIKRSQAEAQRVFDARKRLSHIRQWLGEGHVPEGTQRDVLVRELMASHCVPIELPTGHELFRLGDEAGGAGLWLLEEGVVLAMRGQERAEAPAGPTGLLAPCLLGDAALLAELVPACSTRIWSLRTERPCRLWQLRGPALRADDLGWCEVVQLLKRSFLMGPLRERIHDCYLALQLAAVEDGSLVRLLGAWLDASVSRELAAGPDQPEPDPPRVTPPPEDRTSQRFSLDVARATRAMDRTSRLLPGLAAPPHASHAPHRRTPSAMMQLRAPGRARSSRFLSESGSVPYSFYRAKDTGSCSLQKTLPFVGPISTWDDVRAMLKARSHNSEIIITTETRIDQAAQWSWRQLRMGYAHTVVIMRGEHSCKALRAILGAYTGCVWFDQEYARGASPSGPVTWSLAEALLRNIRWREQPAVVAAFNGSSRWTGCGTSGRTASRSAFQAAHAALIGPALRTRRFSMERPGPACHWHTSGPEGLKNQEGLMRLPHFGGQWPEALGGRALGELTPVARAFLAMLAEAGTPMWPDLEDPGTQAAAAAVPSEKFSYFSAHIVCDWSGCGMNGMFLPQMRPNGTEPCNVAGHFVVSPDKPMGKRFQLLHNGAFSFPLAHLLHGPGGAYFATNLVELVAALSTVAVAAGRTLAVPQLSCDFPWMHRGGAFPYNGSHYVPWRYLNGGAFAPYGPSISNMSCEWFAWVQHGPDGVLNVTSAQLGEALKGVAAEAPVVWMTKPMRVTDLSGTASAAHQQ
eukprot:XP_001694867.1 predicted protein [Chlamydomonas reinhardtii]